MKVWMKAQPWRAWAHECNPSVFPPRRSAPAKTARGLSQSKWLRHAITRSRLIFSNGNQPDWRGTSYFGATFSISSKIL